MNIKEEFLKLYNLGYQDKDIAPLLNRNASRISQIRKEFKLSRNFKFKKPDFLDLYNKGLKDCEIAKILNTSDARISEYRRSINLISNKSSNIFITEIQEQVILGTVLGDGHLYNYKDTSMLRFDHCKKQKEYIYFKYNILKNLCKYNQPKYLTSLDKRSNKINEKYSLHTKSFIELKKYRNMFYQPKKIISKEICSLLKPLAIAIFFMDDGYKHKNAYFFSTNNFNIESIKNFQDFLYNNYKIESSMHKNKVIYIKSNSRDKFTKIIEPFIIESMKYKLCPYKIA